MSQSMFNLRPKIPIFLPQSSKIPASVRGRTSKYPYMHICGLLFVYNLVATINSNLYLACRTPQCCGQSIYTGNKAGA